MNTPHCIPQSTCLSLMFNISGKLFRSGASYLWFSCTRDLNNDEINLIKLGFEHNEFWNIAIYRFVCCVPLKAFSRTSFPFQQYYQFLSKLSVSRRLRGSLCCRCFLLNGWSLYAGQPLSWTTQAGRLCCSLPLDRSANSHLSIIQTLIFTEPLNDWPLFYTCAWNEPKATVGTSKIRSQSSQIILIWWRNQSKMPVHKWKSTF